MPDFNKLAFPGSGCVQVVETAVRDCAVESVVVYADRAEVKRRVLVGLTAGKNEVVIHGLSTCIDKNSIRIEGKGEAMITDVIYSSKTTEEVHNSGSKEEYEVIKDEIQSTELDLERLSIKEQVLKKEKTLLSCFADHVSTVHSIEGKNDSLSQLFKNDNVIAVMEFFEQYEAKVADLDSRLSKVTDDIILVKEKLSVLSMNADKLNPEKAVRMTDTLRSVHVGLETSDDVEGILFVSYVVSQASWSSAYDVRVFSKDKAMKVQYYGFIKQQTGEDWENAKISLSTAQPSIGGSAPDLPTRIIRFKKPIPTFYDQSLSHGSGAVLVASYDVDRTSREIKSAKVPKVKGSASESVMFGSARAQPPPTRASRRPPPPKLEVDVAKVTAGLFNATYSIPRPATIPADNTQHKVTVALVDLAPDFHYNSVPRLSPHFFLQAKAKNTSPYTMLAGPANIFLDNNFIAKSELTDVSPNEEFTISLGVDQSLRITCQPVGAVHNTRSGLRSKTTSITYTHKFQVKNTKTHPVIIHLSEQVPLSSDEKVKVNISEPPIQKVQVRCALPSGHAVLNESNNMEWHVSVRSGQELELRLVYNVEYPAQDHVKGLPK